MAIYQVEAPDGKIIKLEGPDGASDDEIISKAQLLYKPEKEEETSAAKSFGHGILKGAIPTAAGIASGALGAGLGMFGGPVGSVAGALGLGMAGSAAASAAQEKFLEANPKFAEFIGLSKKQQELEAKKHPYASFAGELAPNLLALRPSTSLLRSGANLGDEAAALLRAEKQAALINAGLGSGVGAGLEVGQQALGEEPIDWTKVGIAGGVGALGHKETALGRGIARAGEFPLSTSAKEALEKLRRPGAEALTKEERIVEQNEALSKATNADEARIIQDEINRLEGIPAEVKPVGAEVPKAEEITPTKLSELPSEKGVAKADELAQVKLSELPEAKAIQEPTEVAPKISETPSAIEPTKVEDILAPQRVEYENQLKTLVAQRNALDREPKLFAKFLREQGVNPAEKADLGLERIKRPDIFRKSAPSFDELTSRAIDQGILPPSGDNIQDVANMREHVSDYLAQGQTSTGPDLVMNARKRELDDAIQTMKDNDDRRLKMAELSKGFRELGHDNYADAVDNVLAQNHHIEPDDIRTLDDALSKLKEPAKTEVLKEMPATEPVEADMARQAKIDAAEAEARRVPGTQDEDIPLFEIAHEPTEKLVQVNEQLTKDVRSALDKMGLQDVAVKFEDSMRKVINGQERQLYGSYLNKLMKLSLAGDDVHRTMNHESLHAMKDLGFFTKRQWDMLEHNARTQWLDKYNIRESYKGKPEYIQLEEAIAKAFADYSTQKAPVKTLMSRIKNVLKKLGSLLKGHGFNTVDDLFSKAKSGKLSEERFGKRGPREEMYETAEAKNPSVDEERKIDYAKNQPPLSQWEIPSDTKLDRKDSLIYKLQDKYIDTKRLLQAIQKTGKDIGENWNAYTKEELYHGRVATGIKNFLGKELAPVVKDMDKHKITPLSFDEYLHNRHAIERNEQIAKINLDMPDGGSGIMTADAKKYLDSLPPEKAKAFESIAKKVDAIVKDTQRILVENGLEEKSTIDAWNKTYKNYVPLFREDVDFATSGGGTGKGFSSKGGFSRRAMGSEKGVSDIFANIAIQRERAIIRAEKARVGRSIYGLSLTNPNPDFWLTVNPDHIKDPQKVAKELEKMGLSAADAKNIMDEPRQKYIDPNTGLVSERINPLLRNSDHVLPVRIDGKDRYVFFNPNNERSMRMVSALKNLDADQLGTELGMVAKATRWIAAVNTQYNPVFGIYNFVRDTEGALFNLSTTALRGKQVEVSKQVLPALKGIYQDLRAERSGKEAKGEYAELWRKFQKAGGQTGYSEQFKDAYNNGNIVERELKNLNKGNVKKVTSSVFNWLSDYNDSMENAVRLAAFKTGLDNGMSEEKAASLAKNLTVNFNRRGEKTQQLNALYAFFNASVQGTARLHETLTGPAGKKIIAGGMLLGVGQALALDAAGIDEDDIPDFVKERSLIIPIGDKKYAAIPMPLGLHVLPTLGRVPTEYMLSGQKDAGKRISNLTGTIMDAFNPIGNSGLSVQTLTPTILDPIAALSENKDAFGRPIAKMDRGTNPTPGYTRARDSASFISKQLSEFLNYASGGTKYQKGFLSPTPDQLDYLIGQATGGVGREALKVEQAITSPKEEEIPTYKYPLVGKFYGDIGSNAAQASKFYDNVTKMANFENEIKGRAKDRGDIQGFMKENPEARLWSSANTFENKISEINKNKKALQERNASPEVIKRLEDQKVRLMTQFNELVKNAEKR